MPRTQTRSPNSRPAGSPSDSAALAPGTHTSQAFQPAVTFTVPEGWAKPSDEPRYLQLRPVISGGRAA